METIAAIKRVCRNRINNGASKADIIQWLDSLIYGAWKHNENMQILIGNLQNDIYTKWA